MTRSDATKASAAGGAWTGRGVAIANRIDRVIGDLCKGVIVVSGIALTAVMTANVAARYALPSGGFRWAQELPMMLFPLFVIAGITLAAQAGAHMAVEWLYGRFGSRGKARLFVASQFCSAASMLVLSYHAAVVGSIASIERSPILGVPNSLGYYTLSAGAVLVALVMTIAAVRVAVNGWDARPVPKTEDMPL